MQLKRSFALIELIVVVAIIAVLAAIAMPNYKMYVARGNIHKAVITLRGVIENAIKMYQTTGTFNYVTSFSYNGVNITDSVSAYNEPHIYYLSYYSPAYWGETPINIPAGDTMFAFAAVKGLQGIPGYVAPGPQLWVRGTNAVLAMGVKVINGQFVIKCGMMWPNTDDIPLQYLPKACQCGSVRNWAQFDGAC